MTEEKENQKSEKKSKLFPSKRIKGMLTDGQGAYYPNDEEKIKMIEGVLKPYRVIPDSRVTRICMLHVLTIQEQKFQKVLNDLQEAYDIAMQEITRLRGLLNYDEDLKK